MPSKTSMDQAQSLRLMMNQRGSTERSSTRHLSIMSLDAEVSVSGLALAVEESLSRLGTTAKIFELTDPKCREEFDAHLCILSPESLRSGEALHKVVQFLNKFPVKSLDVVVISVTTGREGLEIFQEFQGGLKKIRGCDTKYIGHLFRSREFLVDLVEERIEPDQVSLIARSLHCRWNGHSENLERDLSGKMRSLKNRFRTEPVRRKPRMLVGRFWRALLGERN